MTSIRVPGHPDLCVDDGGQGGLPILFVHSLGGSASHWSAQLDHLRGERRAVALDLRAHGCSKPPEDGDYSIESLAKDIESAAVGLDLRRFVLVGHSMGGSVAIEYAGANPERVVGLLLVDASGSPEGVPKDEAESFMEALRSDRYSEVVEEYWNGLLAGSSPDVAARVLQELRKTPREAIISVLKDILVYNPLDALGRYRGPVLVVFTPFNDIPSSLHNLIPGVPNVKVTRTGHWLQMDKPDEFNRIMDGFIASVQMAEVDGGEIKGKLRAD